MSTTTVISRAIGILDSRQGMRLASFIDQIGFSAASFVVTLVFIRTYTKSEFAAYGIGLFATLSLAGVYRVSLAIPTALWDSHIFDVRRRAVPGVHLFIIGCVLGSLVLSLICFRLVGAGNTTTLIALSFVATATTYLSLDIDRVVLFRTRRPSQALLVSGSYSFVMALTGAIFFIVHPPFAIGMGVLAAIGVAKTTIVSHLSGRPDWHHARLLFRRLLRTTVGWNSAGNFASSSYMILPQWILGFQSTASEVAGFTAVRTPMQPVMVLIRSLDIVDKVTSGKIGQRNRDDIRAHYKRVYFLYLGVCTVACIVMFFLAEPVVRIVLGTRYAGFSWTLRITALLLTLTATAAPLETVVYQQMAYKPYAISQIIGGALGGLCAIPLSSMFGASGAVVGSIIGWLVPYAYLLRRFRAAVRAA